MAEPSQCQLCSQPATVHLTQIINNHVHTVHLCEACSQTKGVTDPKGFSLSAPLGGAAFPGDKEGSGPACPTCGQRFNQFKEQGRLGCPDCYEAFTASLTPLLADMHHSLQHAGKVPVRQFGRLALSKRSGALQRELEAAITEERYEDAARLRDELRTINEQAAEPTA